MERAREMAERFLTLPQPQRRAYTQGRSPGPLLWFSATTSTPCAGCPPHSYTANEAFERVLHDALIRNSPCGAENQPTRWPA